MALADLTLSRSRLDKVSEDRSAPGLLERLLLDPTTSLLLLRDGSTPVHPEGGDHGLRTLGGPAAAELVEALGGAAAVAAAGQDPGREVVAVHLGRFPDDDVRAPGALVGLLLPDTADGAGDVDGAGASDGANASDAADDLDASDASDASHDLDDPDGADASDGADGERGGTSAVVLERALAGETGDLRSLGALLPATDAGALTEAVALHHWHRSHPRCPRCGAATRVGAAGHERVCLVDGSTHHPRHDPAVIMTVTDPAGRLLLGHQGRWPQGRFSAFAGFVEPGESLEGAVARELLEEAGVHVKDVVYLGSQPWPFPASLMLAFHAETDDTVAVPDGDEITEARWFDRQGLRDAVASGEVTVPPSVSVARRLIERWLGGPLVQDGSWP